MQRTVQLIKYYDMFTHEVKEVEKRKKISEAAFYRRKTEQMKLKSMAPQEKERYLREKAEETTCRCRHFTGTEPCTYRTCRHKGEDHP